MSEALKRIQIVVDNLKETQTITATKYLAASNTSIRALYDIMQRGKEDPYILAGLIKGVDRYIHALNDALNGELKAHKEALDVFLNGRMLGKIIREDNKLELARLLDLLVESKKELLDIQKNLMPLPVSSSTEIEAGALETVDPLFDLSEEKQVEVKQEVEVSTEEIEQQKRFKNFKNSTVEEILERNQV